MFASGIDADEAFEMLIEQSQHHNVKLYLIAEHAMKSLTDVSDVDELTSRSVHRALVIAYQRVG
jgi:hypothetical protein